jgi:putative transposase
MIKTFKYRLFPTKHQLNILQQTLEECRWLYNQTLAYRKNAWETEQRHTSWYDTNARIPILKAEHPALKLVHSQVLQEVTKRVDLAFKAFFSRVKSGEKPGYPRFKGYARYDSFTYTQSGFTLDSKTKRLSLSKIGDVYIELHRPLKGTILNLTIIKSSTDKWYACFSVECPANLLPPNPNQVGLDAGLATFATLSDGVQIENPRFFRKREKA